MTDRLQGIDDATARVAIDRHEPFPGGRGFAGALDDGRLVRDVLGRYPVFVESSGEGWAFDPTDLEDPRSMPAGAIREGPVERLHWKLPRPSANLDDETAVDRLRVAISESVTAVPNAGTAVAFSGGVDSGIIAAMLDAPAYVAGFDGAPDLRAAADGANAIGRSLHRVGIDHDDIRRAAVAVARSTDRTDSMNVSIAIPLYLVAERAADDGFDRLAIGHGADELFGGYQKVARADHRVAASSVRDAAHEMLGRLPRQLERDVLAIRAAGIEPVAPLLDDRIVRVALRLDDTQLVRDGVRKYCLRRAARSFLPASLATRRKKAIQYGTYVSRELDRLARQDGFKRRLDGHVGRYVESLVTEAK